MGSSPETYTDPFGRVMPYTEFISLAAKQVCLGPVKRVTWTGFVANIRTSSYSLKQLIATCNKLICCMTSFIRGW